MSPLNFSVLLAILILVFIYLRSKTDAVPLNNKSILITGGSSGLGLQIAEELVLKGCKVLIVARTLKTLQNAQSLIKSKTGSESIFMYQLDVTSYEECKTLIHKIEKEFDEEINPFGPKIDYVFCCAGKAKPGLFLSQNIKTFKESMEVNYFGALNIIKTVLPSLMLRKQGGIVLVGSTLSLLTIPGYSDYSPSKWALRSLFNTVETELSGSPIRMHMYFPPNMDTPGFHQEQLLKPLVTKEIEGESSFLPCKKCAAEIIKGVENGQRNITSDWLTYLLRALQEPVLLRGNRWRSILKNTAKGTLEITLLPLVYTLMAGINMFSRLKMRNQKKN